MVGSKGFEDKSSKRLTDLTVQELTAFIDEVQAVRSAKLEIEKAALIAEFRERAAALGLALESLFAPSGVPEPSCVRDGISRGKVAAKYRSPYGDEWTGRGRKPRWLERLIADGREKDEFLISR